MLYLLLGLVSFLGLHSIRVIAPQWRERRIATIGAGAWKGAYSLLALASLVLLVWGYQQARQAPVLIWVPPPGLRHAAALLMLPAFILLVAAYIPRNHLKARLGHPMLLGVKLWALAHLLVNGWLHGVLLFAGFLLWAILTFRSARRRPGSGSTMPPKAGATLLSLILGVILWAGFAFYLHVWLIGVAPFSIR